ncbi:MAG: adenylate kinase [Anaerolineaceae bacterium]|nr:adenylate kinase [Anaerolineaceae bacterium]
MYIVLLGPPGAGKGTQAEVISEKMGLIHVSSGDLFRENIKNETELGKLAQGYISRGELVPDEVTIGMVQNRLMRPDNTKGALLDGFPRTPAQAQALDAMLQGSGAAIKVVPYISVPEDVLIERLSGRWTCRAASHVFHSIYNPPRKNGVCDVDGSELYQREDDKPETVLNRIQVFNKQTQPLIAYYRGNGLLVEIDGTQEIGKVTSDLIKAIEG